MPHVTKPAIATIMVAARTTHPPHETCGMKSRMSTMKASRDVISVGIVRIKRPSRKRGE
jgi:hypothetical protein